MGLTTIIGNVITDSGAGLGTANGVATLDPSGKIPSSQIPESAIGVPTSRMLTINGTAYDLSADRSWTVTATETDTLATVTARGATFTNSITSGVGNWIKFSAANETDTNDGKIGSGVFQSGLNIVGAQTVAGTGRQIRLWGTVIDSNDNTFLHTGNYSSYALVNGIDSEQTVGGRIYYFNNGAGRMNADARWNESGFDADLGCLHIWAWTAGGSPYGRAGLALYNDGSYQYLTTKSGTSGLFINNTQIVTNGGTWAINISGSSANTSSISYAVGGAYTWTGTQYFQSNLGGYSGSLSGPALQAWASGGNSAFMSFHRSAAYAVNFGLDADNVLRIGGWSASANRWQLDMSGNNTVASSFRAPSFYTTTSGNNAYITGDGGWGMRVQNDSGYIWLGPANTGTAHIYTDRPSFYFNKDLLVNGNTVLNSGNFTSYIDAPNKAGTSYYQANTWIQLNGAHGLYAPSVNNAHFYPNDASYGAWRLSGTRNGWGGIEFNSGNGNITLMIGTDSNLTGFHNNGYGWQFFWSGGSLYCYKNSYGSGAQALVLDGVNSPYAYNMNQYVRTSDGPTFNGVYTNNWFRANGDSGLYTQDYGGHFRRTVSASHGTWEAFGYNKGGYVGMCLNDPGGYLHNLMYSSTGKGGIYSENGAGGWNFYYNRDYNSLSLMTSGNGGTADIIYWTHILFSYGSFNSFSGPVYGSYFGPSDIRYKKNIRSTPYGLDEILQLNTIMYEYDFEENKAYDTHIGFSAQEVLTIMPELVIEDRSSGNNGSANRLAMNTNGLQGVIVNAIQEQNRSVEELKYEIEELKYEIAQLKSQLN